MTMKKEYISPEMSVDLMETTELLVESFKVDDNTPVSPGTSLSRQKNWEEEEEIDYHAWVLCVSNQKIQLLGVIA